MESASVLALEGVSKHFAGVAALRDITFGVRAGEVHSLLGENGAGKSTLIKILGGLHQPDKGSVLVDGSATSFHGPRDASKAGIAVVHQELLLFPDLTVVENIFLGHAKKTSFGALDWSGMRRDARRLLEELDSHELDVEDKVGILSVANRQRIEIARALAQNARVLILDEPTAALSETDALRLQELITRLKNRNIAIVYVSHRMQEIFRLSDRVTVLRDGGYIGTRSISNVTEPQLIEMMVGRPISQLFPKEAVTIGEPVLELRGVGYGDEIKDIDLCVRSGEIVGIAGIVGSGRTETAQIIFGLTPATSGQILVKGKEARINSPGQARDMGIGYVPEDRAHQGLVRSQTIRENLSLAVLRRVSRKGMLDARRERRLARYLCKRFNVRATGIEQRVATLSGGNQQKVVLGKWIAAEPSVLIMDEPTRGIDVGAKAEIYALMTSLARQGMAILMISSELPEVLGLSDQILVMSGGRIVSRFSREDANPNNVGAAMTNSMDVR